MNNDDGIYIASKTKHAGLWIELRNRYPIISTWIDEAGVGETSDWPDLWNRCISEASMASALVLYKEKEEILKGAWVEVGAALAYGVPVFAVGIEDFSVKHHPGITLCNTIEEAFEKANKEYLIDASFFWQGRDEIY
jgi:hypothetical protein